jgi:hypothetical protein
MRLNLPFDPERLRRTLQHLDRKLDQIEARVPDVLSVRFDDLAREDVCAKIFQHCLPYPHDPAWWSVLDQMNLQINLGHMLDYFRAYEPQLTKLAKIAKHTMLVQMNQSVTSNDDDGLTIQEETLATSFADAMKLFQEHAIAVGEAPDAVMNKNLNLIATLEANGALQIMTARCNGRMFGYLMSVIAPSLERSDLSTALQTLFFASPLIKGVGMRLQRESVKALIAKGVKQIDFHAGVRGSGPRLGTLYRRLGAAEYGQMYRLSL